MRWLRGRAHESPIAIAECLPSALSDPFGTLSEGGGGKDRPGAAGEGVGSSATLVGGGGGGGGGEPRSL